MLKIEFLQSFLQSVCEWSCHGGLLGDAAQDRFFLPPSKLKKTIIFMILIKKEAVLTN